MGVDLWAFKVKESSKSKDAKHIWWEDEDNNFPSLDSILPSNYFSNTGLGDSDWKLFKHIGMNLEGDPYMSNEDFAKSVKVFNRWYEDWVGNGDEIFVLQCENNGYLIANYHSGHLKDLYEYLNMAVEMDYGIWISI